MTWISYNIPSFPKAIVIGVTWSKFGEIDIKIILKVKAFTSFFWDKKVEFLGVFESIFLNPVFYFGGKQNEKLL